MRRKHVCLVAGILFAFLFLVGCGNNQGASPSASPSASPMATTSGEPLSPPEIKVTPEQAAQVIGETPEKVFMQNETQGTATAGKVFAIALPEDTGVTWQVTADDGVEELPDGTVNVNQTASDGQGGTSPSPAGSPGQSPGGSPAASPAASPASSPAQSPAGSPGGSPAASPAGSPGASPSPGGSPGAEGNFHVWGFKIANEGQYNIRISDTNNAASETTFTITVQAAS